MVAPCAALPFICIGIAETVGKYRGGMSMNHSYSSHSGVSNSSTGDIVGPAGPAVTDFSLTVGILLGAVASQVLLGPALALVRAGIVRGKKGLGYVGMNLKSSNNSLNDCDSEDSSRGAMNQGEGGISTTTHLTNSISTSDSSDPFPYLPSLSFFLLSLLLPSFVFLEYGGILHKEINDSSLSAGPYSAFNQLQSPTNPVLLPIYLPLIMLSLYLLFTLFTTFFSKSKYFSKSNR